MKANFSVPFVEINEQKINWNSRDLPENNLQVKLDEKGIIKFKNPSFEFSLNQTEFIALAKSIDNLKDTV